MNTTNHKKEIGSMKAKVNNLFKDLDHKDIWIKSMIGMTIGFMATLIIAQVFAIIGIYSKDNIFVQIKKALTYITPFAIGAGVAAKLKLDPLRIMAVALAATVAAHSTLIPHFVNGGVDFSKKTKVGIELIFLPGDVFAAWIASVLMVYIVKIYKFTTPVDIFIFPLMGLFMGTAFALSITYITSLFLVSLEYVVEKTINHSYTLGILLAPILGMIMGLALSLPTSSAAMAFAVNLHGDAAVAAMAATASQMIAFGVMTYMSTKNIGKSLAVGFGTTMIQMPNFSRKPLLLVIPTVASMLSAMLAVAIFHNHLGFEQHSVTSGMGTCCFYGPIFTMQENGWSEPWAWAHLLGMQLAFPVLVAVPMMMLFTKFSWIKEGDLAI